MFTKTKIGGLALSLILLFAVTVQPAFAVEADSEETNATVTFVAGNLELVSVPEFNFGSQTISSATETYTMTNTVVPVKVSDARGSGEGWSLNVSLSPFMLEDGETESLQGAYIQIENATVSAVNGTIGDAPAVAGASLQIDSDNSETPVFSAALNAGRGVWQMNWSMGDASLVVLPGTAHPGLSTATLTWSLQAAP